VSITVILDMKIRAELLEEFLSRYQENLPASLEFEGCEYVNTTQAVDDPTRIVLVEGWSSEEAFAAYGAWRADRGDPEAFQKYYDGPPSLVKLTTVEGF
jgi:quinol monooxygenase YgiN